MSSSRIALVISDKETNAQIKKLGVGLLELRADLLKKKDPAYVAAQIKLRKKLKVPILLTVRNQKKEGANREFPDQLKWEILKAAMPLADAVDIELSSPLLKSTMAQARRLRKQVIVSSHFFKSAPKDLGSILKKSLVAGADIVKIAAFANSFDDVVDMLLFTWQHRHKKLITMSLGPIGTISRLLLPAMGSMYTYSFLSKPSAPGQIDVHSLKSHLKSYPSLPPIGTS